MFSSSKHIRTYWKTYLGFFISLALLWFTIRQSHIQYSNLQLNWHQIKLFGLSILVFVFTVFFQAQRSRFIWIRGIRDFFNYKTYDSIIIGNFYNCILPGNIGEGVRAWHFHRKNQVSFSNSLAAVFLEKIIDAQLFLPIILLLNFMHIPTSSDYIIIILDIVATVVIIADIFGAIILLSPYYRKMLFKFIPGTLVRKEGLRLLINIKQHLNRLFSSGWMWAYAPMGYVMFALNILQYGLLLKATSIGYPILGPYGLILISSCMIVVSFVPSAPSSIGVVHYGIFTALVNAALVLGVKTEVPLLRQFAVMATLLHASYFIPEVILGVVFLIKERRNLAL